MLKRSMFVTFLTAAVCVLMASISFGQEVTGTLLGTVKDSNGAIVAGATVTLRIADQNVVVRTITTNAEGDFSFPNIQTTTYSVTVEAPNFKKFVQTGVKVNVGERRNIDVILAAGRIDEVVTVESQPVAIDTSSPTNGTVINGDQAREIPINNRNWVQLITLAPGVSNDLADQVYVGTTNPDGQANTINIAVNGARSSQNTFTVDGADVTDRGSNITIQAYPSVDSISEFKILRSLFLPESGRSGGGQINVVTRSGTRQIRGSGFLFWRKEEYNANNYLVNAITGNPPFGRRANGDAMRAPFSYYNWGGTIGGPIYFLNFGERSAEDPLFKRYSRTFFFFSEEARRDRRFTSAITTTVPDAFLKVGRFPIPVCINRTYLGETCTGSNVLPANTPIPTSMINPAALGYLTGIYNKIANPNNPSVGNPFALTDQIENQADFRQEIFKIDHSFNDRWSMYYRFENDKIPTEDGNSLFSSGSGLRDVSTTRTESPGKTHTAQMTYAASPRLIFEGRFTYGYGAILSHNVGLLALSRTTIPVILPFVNTRDRVPTLTGNGFTGFTSFGPYDNFSYKRNYTGTVTWITGNHAYKFGTMFSQYRKNENALSGVNEGSFSSFSATLPTGLTFPVNYTLPDGRILANAITATIAGNLQRWANFLVGNVAAFTQASFDYTADLRQKTIEAFGQDEWKIRPNVTLSYGVRYSYYGPPWDVNGRLSNFVQELYNPALAPAVTGAGNRVVDASRNFCNGLIVNTQNYQTAANNCTPINSPWGKYVIDVSKKDFAPRAGIAWSPWSKTSIRMGYGMYYEQVLNGTFLQNIGANPPYQLNATASNTRLDNPAFNAAAAISLTSQSVRAVQSDWHTPYMQHWALDWQQQLTGKTVVTIAYAGSKGTHLQGLTELNSIPAGKALASQCAPGNNYLGQAAAFTPVPCQLPGYAFRNTTTTAAQGNTNVVGTTVFTDTLILDQLRPYRGFRSIAMVQPRYDSSYHSLQLSAVHRFAAGNQLNAYYTWSKNLTTSPNDRSTSPQDAYNINLEKQLAAFDRRHILSFNYVYEIPYFRKQQGFTGKVLGGWQFNGIATYNSGLPFTVTTSSFDAAGLGILNTNPAARPNITCDPNSGGAKTLQQYFNTTCFQPNPAIADSAGNRILVPNTIGNTARGSVTGPPTIRFDITAVKNIRFGENLRLQLRAEAFNVFNNVNFRALSTNVTSTNFGAVTTVRDPRTMQFGAKIYF